MESGPNDSTRVRRLTGIFRRARVEIFIVVYVRFWLQLSEFSSNLTGHHETKQQNGYGAVDQNIQTFMSNLGYLWLTRTSWIDSAPSEPSNSSQFWHTCTTVAREHVIKGGKSRASNSRRLWEGIISLLLVSRTKTRVLRTRVDLCYHCGPCPACVGKVFSHLLIQSSFSRTSERIYG
jgi:hypothetical protein